MRTKDLSPNLGNPRSITPAKLEQLKRALAEFGDLGGIVFNRKTKQLVGGHQRTSLFSGTADITYVKKYTTPTPTGTVAEGYITTAEGERFSYREVLWDETKEKAANIAANKGAGEWDFPKLGEWMRELDDFAFDLDLTMFDEDERKELLATSGSGSGDGEGEYTKKIVPPIYEPKGDCPSVKSLVDLTKTDKLSRAIASSKIPNDVRIFLLHAAARHSVFNYEQIAEYYAHAPKKVKELMEDSALVIIDFKKAIENGFVVLSEELAEAYSEH